MCESQRLIPALARKILWARSDGLSSSDFSRRTYWPKPSESTMKCHLSSERSELSGKRWFAMLNEGWSQPPRTVVLGSGTHRLQIANINGDGENDVVTATNDGLLTAYESSLHSPLFAIPQPVQFYLVRGLVDFDIDGDGDVDLVATSTYEPLLGFPPDEYSYIYLLETTRQYFDSPSTLLSWNIGDDSPYGIWRVEIGDVNADGANDLLWSGEPREDEPTLAWAEFGADGLLETHVIDVDEKFEDIYGQDAVSYGVGEVELLDLNQDGRPEVFSRGGEAASSTNFEGNTSYCRSSAPCIRRAAKSFRISVRFMPPMARMTDSRSSAWT